MIRKVMENFKMMHTQQYQCQQAQNLQFQCNMYNQSKQLRFDQTTWSSPIDHKVDACYSTINWWCLSVIVKIQNNEHVS